MIGGIIVGAKIYSDEYLLERIKWLYKELGGVPRTINIDAYNSVPSSGTYKNRFGSLNNALLEAGITPYYKIQSKKEMINNLKKLAGDLGRTPTKRECDKCIYTCSIPTYHKKFNGWNGALKKAGLKINRNSKAMPKDELIELIHRAKDLLGRAPNSNDLQNIKFMPSITPYYRVWGSWSKALRAAEL